MAYLRPYTKKDGWKTGSPCYLTISRWNRNSTIFTDEYPLSKDEQEEEQDENKR